jgi:hypothetical protein
MIRKIKNLYQLAGRNKATLVTNVFGLSIGLATTILLATFILHEWSYDRHFSNAETSTVCIRSGLRQKENRLNRSIYGRLLPKYHKMFRVLKQPFRFTGAGIPRLYLTM